MNVRSDMSHSSMKWASRVWRKGLWNRWVLSLEWKTEGVIDGESEGGDCDEVMSAAWGEPGGGWWT